MRIGNREIESMLNRLPSAARDSQEHIEARAERVLQQLREAGRTDDVDTPEETLRAGPCPPFSPWKRILVWSAPVLLGIVLIVALNERQQNTRAAVLEDRTGTALRTRGGISGESRSVEGGMVLNWGDVIRTNGSSGAAFVLTDGSRVEMRSSSELSLEQGTDGTRIQLNRGDLLVSAAKQRHGHLYVQTNEVTVSVVGTVFLVKAEKAGSRVAVIEGEVQVQEGPTVKTLLPGQHLTTVPSKETSPVAVEISWSQQAANHLALLAQSVATPVEQYPQFEVASVRENTSGSTVALLDETPERVTIQNATLERIIRYALRDNNTEISGPVLLNSKRYDLLAKAPSGTPDSQLRPMLLGLLTDRFKMRFHRETIDMPVYALLVDAKGHKLNEIKPGETNSGVGAAEARPDGLSTMFRIGDLAGFAANLSRRLDRPVVDKTGLPGRFNILLTYVSDQRLGEGVSGPSLPTALQEQLGLRLVPEQGSIEMLVIDQIHEPAPN